MKSKFVDFEETYDGAQLASLRSYLKHGLLGDSILAWVGPCQIDFEHMVDGEDLLAKAEIRGDRMLHFIVEKFECTLLAAVALQRLLASIVKDELMRSSGDFALAGRLYRVGDDLYVDDLTAPLGADSESVRPRRKLSISIATQSPISSLIHFAVNVTNQGTPVPTLSLGDLKVEPKKFALNVMESFTREVATILEATMKVRWVK